MWFRRCVLCIGIDIGIGQDIDIGIGIGTGFGTDICIDIGDVHRTRA